MKFSVTKQEMQEKLSNIQNIVEKKNTMPILSHFLLSAEKKDSYIIATDLETALKEPIDIELKEEGKICIPARKLFEIVREIEGDLFFESIDEQWIKVIAGNSNFRLACLPPNEFPVWPELSPTSGIEGEEIEEIDIASSQLHEMIEKTIYSAGESDTRYTLNGLLFHVTALSGLAEKNGSKHDAEHRMQHILTVVGTDGHRLALIKALCFVRSAKAETIPQYTERKMIVPKKALSEIRRFLSSSGGLNREEEEEVKIYIGKNYILLNVSGIKFLTRLIEGTYPNYEQVIPLSNEIKISLNREAFIKALRRVSVMSRERANAVRIDFGDNILTILSSNPDIGEAKEELAILSTSSSSGGVDLSIGFNARYLIEALSAINSENVMLEIQDPLSSTLLCPASGREEDENYKCVIMPMRI
ncbi:MAG: DNA polymerase III subunit beta [Nitrospirae bacterium]|nr:DNA polymerase III subunit beta [Nitrospirota bacterium]